MFPAERKDRQPNVRTIEGLLFGALVKVTFIHSSPRLCPKILFKGRGGVPRQFRQSNQGMESSPINGHLFADSLASPTIQVNLGRAARTDAGVHAAGNVVSIKMIMSVPGVPDMVSRINEELPPGIRLWGFVSI
jgi:tRNA pseudouridine(38-40) synthase